MHTRAPLTHEQRRRQREHLEQVKDRRVAEFGGELASGTVIRQLAIVREGLLRSDGAEVSPGAVEDLTRRRLQARIPSHTVIPGQRRAER